MCSGNDGRPWFAVQIRTSSEAVTNHFLQSNGFESFLPLVKSRRRWSDRIKNVETPMFPGYLFCRFDINKRLPILQAPGVLQIVGSGKTPIPVDEAEITAIHRLAKTGLPAQPWPFLQIGQVARIEQGPLSGLTGIVIEVKSVLRVILSVTLLRRSVAVEVAGGWLSAPRATEPAWPRAELAAPILSERHHLAASRPIEPESGQALTPTT